MLGLVGNFPGGNAWTSVTVAPRSVHERPFAPIQSDALRRSPFALVT